MKFEFNWVGKDKLNLSDKTNKKLINIKGDGVNESTTQNMYIEGDNLEVLKVLKKDYKDKIKCIYIDPPYNTGNKLIYNDKFTYNKNDLLGLGYTKDEVENIIKNNTKKDLSHSCWLNMMYPRLKIARDLLTDDGVIFISIDDNEQANLKLLCDDVFGESNFVACLPTIMNLKGNNDEFGFAGTHEYTLVYAKIKEKCLINEFILNEEEILQWKIDEIGLYKKGATLKRTGADAPREKRPLSFYPILEKNNELFYITNDECKKIYDKDTNSFNENYLELLKKRYQELGFNFILPIIENQYASWRWGFKTFKENKSEVIIIKNNNDISLYKKQRPDLGEIPYKKPKTIFYKPEYSSGNGTSELKKLFDNNKPFEFPKPTSLIKDFLHLGISKNDEIILDFFSGSATTAHAVMQLNAEDGGNRKYIMVQLPENCTEKTEAYKFLESINKPKNICEIGKERIRRTGAKILEENKDKDAIKSLDVGFKVFRLED